MPRHSCRSSICRMTTPTCPMCGEQLQPVGRMTDTSGSAEDEQPRSLVCTNPSCPESGGVEGQKVRHDM